MSTTYVPERAMFICAHPDDLEFGVAGTVASWAKHGCKITYVIITDGNAGSHAKDMTPEKLAEMRRREQTAAADLCGVAHVHFLGYDDGLLINDLELRKKLVRLIRQHKPNVVACMDPTNFFPSDNYINHPDHRAAGTAALDAAFPAAEMPMLYPDLHQEGLDGHKPNYVYLFFIAAENANCFVDISDTIDTKIESLKAHESQMVDWDPSERIRTWAAETGRRVGFKYAEQFRRITLKDPDADEPQTGAATAVKAE